jgi:uncharacterized protein (DUF1015 family)
MSIIKAFKCVRPVNEYVSEIAALPYDVYSRAEAKEVVKDNPLSFLNIDRAETFFDHSIDMYSKQVYEKARDTLQDMIDKKLYIQDEKPCLYIYRLVMEGRAQTGLVTCTSIDDYLQDKIKKHELTRATKEQDRINHVDYLDANTGPIFLTYRAQKDIDKIIDEWISKNQPEYDFVAKDEISHTVWVIDDQEIIKQLTDLFAIIPNLYIADGHHRAASAVKVGLKRREEHPDYTGEEEFNYFLSVLFPDNQLKILDYNRAVSDLDGLTTEAFINSLKNDFEVVQKSSNPIKPTEKGTFGMYVDHAWYLLKAKDGSYDKEDPVLSLDVSILQLNLLAPILGIVDPRTDERIDFIGGIRGLAELERRANSDMEVAFAMVPTSTEELMNIADAGMLMPPKSTWFEPKLRSGIFIHLLK